MMLRKISVVMVAIFLAFSQLFWLGCAVATLPPPTEPPGKPSSPGQVAATASASIATPKPSVDTPRHGGILTLGAPSDPPSLDPHRESGAAVFNLINPSYSGLVQYDPLDNEKIIPDLAERWDISGDGMSYIFYLRKGVKWHDGQPFTSQDVKFSLERMPTYNARKRDALKPISRVDAADDYTVKIALNYTNSSLPAVLAQGSMPIGPKHVIEAKGDLKNDVVGTGPFKFKRYSAGVSFEAVKNNEYFVPGRPYLDGIVAYIIKDKATRFAAFRTGQVKMPVPQAVFTPSEVKTISRDVPQAVVQPAQVLQAAVFFMNMSQKPWDDIRVRKAVHLATDRQAAIKAIGEGEGMLDAAMIAGEWAIPDEELLRQPGFRQPKDADITEARRLLADAGLAVGFQPKILTRAGYADYIKNAEFMVDQLSKIGIRGIIDAQDSAIYTDRLNRSAYETMATNPNLQMTDPDDTAYLFGKGNRYMISDDKLHELFDKQTRTADPAERKKVVYEMQYRIVESAPLVANLWLPSYTAFWPEVKNYKAGIGFYNTSKYQDVWLAK